MREGVLQDCSVGGRGLGSLEVGWSGAAQVNALKHPGTIFLWRRCGRDCKQAPGSCLTVEGCSPEAGLAERDFKPLERV